MNPKDFQDKPGLLRIETPDQFKPVAVKLVESIKAGSAAIARKYLSEFKDEMSTAELIGCYRKLVDTGAATDTEECALLDLLDPSQML